MEHIFPLEEEGETGATSEDVAEWAACDVCDEWRELPPGSAARSGAGWTCSMNSWPDAARNMCSYPSEWDAAAASADIEMGDDDSLEGKSGSGSENLDSESDLDSDSDFSEEEESAGEE